MYISPPCRGQNSCNKLLRKSYDHGSTIVRMLCGKAKISIKMPLNEQSSKNALGRMTFYSSTYACHYKFVLRLDQLLANQGSIKGISKMILAKRTRWGFLKFFFLCVLNQIHKRKMASVAIARKTQSLCWGDSLIFWTVFNFLSENVYENISQTLLKMRFTVKKAFCRKIETFRCFFKNNDVFFKSP